MIATLATLAVALTDQIGLGSLLVALALGIPGSILAYGQVKDRRDSAEAREFAHNVRLFFRENGIKIEDIHRQTRTSNGITLAQYVERNDAQVAQLRQQLDGHLSDGHGGSD